jgi:hypothetical protein
MGVANMMSLIPGHRIKFRYENWKGVISERHLIIESLGFGRSEYHGETVQWFLNGFDLDKQARRSYAMVDIDTSSMEFY